MREAIKRKLVYPGFNDSCFDVKNLKRTKPGATWHERDSSNGLIYLNKSYTVTHSVSK